MANTMNDQHPGKKKRANTTPLLAQVRSFFSDEEFAEMLDDAQLSEENRKILHKFKHLG